MKRGGAWVLGLLVIGAMAGGGWFAIQSTRPLGTVDIILLRTPDERDVTGAALQRGADVALREAGLRAGKFRVQLLVGRAPAPAAWIGTSESILREGDVQPAPLSITAIDTHPLEPTNCFRISPGCERQGAGAAGFAKTHKAVRVTLLRDQASLRSAAIAAAFESSARALGLAVDGPHEALPENIDRILSSKPDLVFYSGEEAPYVNAQRIFSALREKGFEGTLLMGEADPEVSFLATRPRLVEGCYLVSPFAPAPAELAARMGFTPGPHVTAGYYAMKAALEALEWANSPDPAELRRAAVKLPYFRPDGRSTRPCALYRAKNGVFEFVQTLN